MHSSCTANYLENWKCISVLKADGRPAPLPTSAPSHPPLHPPPSLHLAGPPKDKSNWYMYNSHMHMYECMH